MRNFIVALIAGILVIVPVEKSGASVLALADNFNRADASDLGPNWDLRTGGFDVTGREVSPAATGLATFSGSFGDEISFDAFHSGAAATVYAAGVLGYASLNDNLFVKVESNGGATQFNRIYFYFGDNGSNNGAWSESGFLDPTPFSAARVTVRLVGGQVTTDIDEDFDGVADQSFTKGSVPLGLLGAEIGIGGSGGSDVSIDNFGTALADNFNRANASDLGPNWDLRAGGFDVTGREAVPAASGLATFSGSSGNEISFDAFHSGSPSSEYAAALLGYASLSDNLFVKVQSNAPTTQFNRVYFYFGNNGSNNGAWSETGFTFSAPFSAARVTLRLVGDQVTIDIDEDFDGAVDQSFTRGSVPVGLLGADMGISGFGGSDISIDNFGMALADNFNRADASDLGPNWDVQTGGFDVAGREASPAATGLATFSGSFGDEISFNAFHSGAAATVYAAGVLGYASLNDNLFVKVESNGGATQFNRIYFYFGDNGSNNGAWSESGFLDLTPFSAARVTVRLAGDQVTTDIDEDFDGVADQSFTRGSVPVGLLGAEIGIGGSGGSDISIDNVVVPKSGRPIFTDGFESGNTAAWSSSVP